MTDAELDAICGAWPGVTRSIKWEVDLVYSVANKMFAVMCTLGPERGRLSFKVEPERFLELTDQPGIAPAPYMARAFWITLANPMQFGGKQLDAFLRKSYELVMAKLPKKTQAALAESTKPAKKNPVIKAAAKPATAKKSVTKKLPVAKKKPAATKTKLS
jgi:predicted DNA-binding protein (MmcQ/YjbR family)